MSRAADSAATTTAEQDMDEILAREGFKAAPVDHSEDTSKDSTTKRAREVRKQLSILPSLINRAVEASGTTGSGPTGAVLPGARRSVQNAAGASAKSQPKAADGRCWLRLAALCCARLAALAAREARIALPNICGDKPDSNPRRAAREPTASPLCYACDCY